MLGVAWFGLVLLVLMVLVVFGKAPPLEHPCNFPLISIRFGGVFLWCWLFVLNGFGGFW